MKTLDFQVANYHLQSYSTAVQFCNYLVLSFLFSLEALSAEFLNKMECLPWWQEAMEKAGRTFGLGGHIFLGLKNYVQVRCLVKLTCEFWHCLFY
jgi:hypothetical protein